MKRMTHPLGPSLRQTGREHRQQGEQAPKQLRTQPRSTLLK
jgi:hypothetical protein